MGLRLRSFRTSQSIPDGLKQTTAQLPEQQLDQLTRICKGKGACAVPLKDKTWKLARARFEELAKAKDLTIGSAPAKS